MPYWSNRVRGLLAGALLILLGATPALAQHRIDQLGAASAASSTDILPDCQSCSSSTAMVGLTLTQLTTYMNTNLSLNTSVITGGTLGVARGGTGVASWTSAAIPLGAGTSPITFLSEVDGDCVVGSGGAWTAGSCGSSGGSLEVTDGTHSVSSTTTLTLGNGFVVSGSAGSATANLTVTDNTYTTSYQVAAGDMANALNLAGTSGTPALTLPSESSTVFAPGMSLAQLAVTGTVNWSLTNSTGLTMTGLNSTTLYPGTTGSFVANANGTGIDFFAGMQVATTSKLGGVIPDGSTLSLSGATLSCTTSTTSQLGCVKPDGTTITISNGVITASGGSATSITPGTTTIVGASAPCLIENSSSTTMACPGVGTGVITAVGDNVNTNGGILTASTAAIAANAIVTGAGSGTALTGTTPGTGVLTALADNVNTAGGVITAGSSSSYHTATIGWIATVNPNNAAMIIFPANGTLVSLVGNVETAVGSTATVSVYLAASGTACSGGSAVHSSSFNANGTAATNQTLTLTTTSVSAGNRLCLQTTGTTDWTSGTGVGSLTVAYTVP